MLHNAGATIYYSYFGFGFGRTHMTLVGCTGIETNLLNCNYSTDPFDVYLCGYYDYYYYYYGYGSDAGVRCQRGTRINSIVEYSKWNFILLLTDTII